MEKYGSTVAALAAKLESCRQVHLLRLVKSYITKKNQLSSSIFKQDRVFIIKRYHISDIRSPKGVFDQQIVADRFDMNDDACRRVNIFCMPDCW